MIRRLVHDRNEIYPGLWVGSHEFNGPTLASEGFTMVVLTARHHQSGDYGQVQVVNAPLTDDAFMIVSGDLERAHDAADRASIELLRGGKVLVSCKAGQNRSAWVAGWTLVFLGMRGADAALLVQRRRENTLRNWHFLSHLRSLRRDA